MSDISYNLGMIPLTVSQAADQIGLSPRQVCRLVASGQIRATAINARLYLIDPSELVRFKRARQNKLASNDKLPGRPPKPLSP
jgi:excisionase family DNA binding protein